MDMCYMQFHGPDGKTVEGAGSIYNDGKQLPPGQWSVTKADSDTSVIMTEAEMPEHWQKEIKKWSAWGKDYLE